MRHGDTSAAAARIQADVIERMSAEERLLAALEMSLTARALARAGLQRDHPDWSEAELNRHVMLLAFERGERIPRALR